MKHFPVMQVIGLDDAGPFLRLRQTCSCGALISEQTWDVRRGKIPDPATTGVIDAEAYLRHVEEAPL